VQIDTDAGVSGLTGPMREAHGYLMKQYIEKILLGLDPLATEEIWDRTYRSFGAA
jgi:hypothetical protein